MQLESLASRRHLEHIATAAAQGDVNTVLGFISAGGDVNARTINQHTLLHVAARHGHPEVVCALLHADADLDSLDYVRVYRWRGQGHETPHRVACVAPRCTGHVKWATRV